jgi:hypothetical protein
MKALVIATAVLATAISSAAASPQATKPLIVRGSLRPLVVPGDRAMARYTVYAGSQAVRGTLYVRNDLQKTSTKIGLKRSNGYRARVPNRLIRGKRLLYYAAFMDPRTGRSLRLPARGMSTTSILAHPVVISLGAHHFGETKAPEAVVARARADEVGWDINEDEGFHLGPQTLQVGSDRSVWLEDSFNNRLLVWNPGQPNSFARAVPVPYGAGISDVAFGPGSTLYVTRKLVDPTRLVLDKLDAKTGQLRWENRVGLEYAGGPTGNSYPLVGSDSPLRVGPDGTVYYFVGLPEGETGWMPVATAAGRPLAPRAQLRGIGRLQPVARGLRLLGPEFYTPHDEMAPKEVRYALVDHRGRVVRAWRILSSTEFNFIHMTMPENAGGDPLVVLSFLKSDGAGQTWEYEILRLGRHGASARFSLARAIWGDSALDDLRFGPDGKLYQLATSVQNGVVITRYSLGSGRAS